MKKVFTVIIMFLIVFVACAQDEMINLPNYANFKMELLALDIEQENSIKMQKINKNPENKYVIIGAAAFVGIMTLNKFGSEKSALTDNAYYATCGILTVGTLVFCLANKKEKWRPKRR